MNGDHEQREHRHRGDRAHCVFVVGFEVLHEQRHEGRGEHATEQELVDDVGGFVRVAVGAGERGHPERVRECGDPHEPGDAGECGADGDDRARPNDASRLFVAELTTLEAGVGVRERERLGARFE